MKREKVFRWIKSIAFCGVLAAGIAAVSFGVERKASRAKIMPFLERAEEHDVLFIGDSHMLNGVFPMELWRDYGIASYNLGSTGSTIPVTYWTLMNALDYAQPEVVVVGVKDAEKRYKLSGSSGDVHVALDAYPLTGTKIRTIEDLMDDPYAVDDDGNAYTDMKWEYYFTLGKYHARWSELGASDFSYQPNGKKGAETMVGVAVPNDYDIIDQEWADEESGWGYAYLRKIIEECQSRGIEVMLVHLPYPSKEEEQMAANAVYYIAEEYGVHYVDFVNMDQVVDYDTDCFDAYSHLNPSGAAKVTDFLGRYLTDHFDLRDRREDESHAQWHEDYASYLEGKTRAILNQTNLHNLLMLLHDGSYSVCMHVDGDSPVFEDERAMRLLQNIAREHVFEEDAFSKWSCTIFPLERLDEAAAAGEDYFFMADRKSGSLTERVGAETAEGVATSFGVLHYRGDDGAPFIQLERDGMRSTWFAESAQQGEYGVSVLVIDDHSGEVAAQVRM